MGAAGSPDPGYSHLYHNDFDNFTSTSWTISTVGTPTQAIADGDGGQLLVTNTAGAADACYLQLPNGTFAPKAGSQTFFKFAGTLSDVTNDVFYAGLVQKGATTVASITDGIFISKATGSAALTLNIRKASVAVTAAFPAASIPVAGTQFEIGFMVDTLGNVAAFFNPTTGNDVPVPAGGQRGRVVAIYQPSAVPAAVALTPAFGLLNSTAVARTLSVDFLTVVRER
jgi:hypothetical protein